MAGWTGAVIAALALGSGALAAPASAPAPALQEVRAPDHPTATTGKLLPLSEADKESSHETGCNFVFSGPRKDYVQVIGDELMFRTPAGLQVCHISNADAVMETKGAAAVCKGVTLEIRSTGRTTHYEASDSSTGAATLSVTEGQVSHKMRGSWGVAC